MISYICELLNNSKFFKYYIITPWIYAIGTCSEHIGIASRIANKKNKKLIVIKLNIFKKLLKYQICNNDLFDSLEFNEEDSKLYNFTKILFTFLINFEFLLTRSLILINDFTLKIRFPEYIRIPQIGLKNIVYNKKKFFYKKYEHIQKYPKQININLKKDIEFKKKQTFNKLYKVFDKKFVCLHTRDENYRNDKEKRSFRNSQIDSYIPAIQFLIEKGYVVIRIGNHNSDKINFVDDNFLEINNKEPQNFFDVFLIKNCVFFIGTQSGPVDVSFMFDKPTLLTNSNTCYMTFPRNFKDRIIFKRPILNGRTIGINDHLNLPFKYHNYLENNGDLEYYDNTPNEILESVKEFLINLETNNFKKSEKQEKFNNIIKKKIINFFYDTSEKNSFKKHYLATNFIRWIKTQEGTICNFQINLDKNF